uniref:Uncharacterized protein n=1 Tax=Ananas comosus var. bracteatus TaxID=296719 RepID=A0A6V7P2S0_ANACO|nr:unnamed protein product [Ananas comosus var. bracteatus]
MSMLRRRKPSEAEKKPSASSDADADAESSKGKAKKSPSSSSSAAAAAAVGEGKGGRWSCVDSCCWTIGWICSAWWILIFLYNAMPPSIPQYVAEAIAGPPPDPPGRGSGRRARGEAPGGVRPRDRHRGARALGGPPLRRGALPQAPLGRILRRDL